MNRYISLLCLVFLVSRISAMEPEEKVAAGAAIGTAAGVALGMGALATAVIYENSDKRLLGIKRRDYAYPMFALAVAAPFIGAAIAKEETDGSGNISSFETGLGSVAGAALLTVPLYFVEKPTVPGPVYVLAIVGGAFLGGLAGANNMTVPIYVVRY